MSNYKTLGVGWSIKCVCIRLLTIDTVNQALCVQLLVPGGSIELLSKEKTPVESLVGPKLSFDKFTLTLKSRHLIMTPIAATSIGQIFFVRLSIQTRKRIWFVYFLKRKLHNTVSQI